MMEPISFLIWLIVLALVVYLLMWVLGQLALPQPVRTVIVVLVALVILVWLVNRFGLLAL